MPRPAPKEAKKRTTPSKAPPDLKTKRKGKKIKGKEGKSSREQKRVNYDGTRST
jgi:hypothetical protein